MSRLHAFSSLTWQVGAFRVLVVPVSSLVAKTIARSLLSPYSQTSISSCLTWNAIVLDSIYTAPLLRALKMAMRRVTAFVTGAASGLGNATAQRFLQQVRIRSTF